MSILSIALVKFSHLSGFIKSLLEKKGWPTMRRPSTYPRNIFRPAWDTACCNPFQIAFRRFRLRAAVVDSTFFGHLRHTQKFLACRTQLVERARVIHHLNSGFAATGEILVCRFIPAHKAAAAAFEKWRAFSPFLASLFFLHFSALASLSIYVRAGSKHLASGNIFAPVTLTRGIKSGKFFASLIKPPRKSLEMRHAAEPKHKNIHVMLDVDNGFFLKGELTY